MQTRLVLVSGIELLYLPLLSHVLHVLMATIAVPRNVYLFLAYGLFALLSAPLVVSTAAYRWLFYLGGILLLWLIIKLQPYRAWPVATLSVPCFSFAAIHVASVAWNPDASSYEFLYALRISLMLFVLFSYALIAVRLDLPAVERQIMYFIVVSCGWSGVLLVNLAINDFTGDFGFRLTGLGATHNPNLLAVALSVTLIGGIVYWKQITRMFHVALCTAAMSVASIALLMSASRAALLALALSLILFVRQGKVLLVGGIFLAGGAAFLWMAEVFDPLELVTRGDNLRIEIWQDVVSHIAEAPILGYGFGTTVMFAAGPGHSIPEGWASPHNIYLGTMVSTGAVGLAFLLWVFFDGFRVGITEMRRGGDSALLARFCTVTLAYGCIFGLFSFHTIFMNLQPEWLIFWFPLAFLFALANRRPPAIPPRVPAAP